MPPIRIMTWNIQDLSNAKLQVPGMPQALARTVVGQNVDVLIVQEVCMGGVGAAMTTLSNALRAAQGGANEWRGYFLSSPTGQEYYCAFVRDLDRVRPVHRIGGAGPEGTAYAPLRDLTISVFEAWPNANWGASAYPGGPIVCPQRFPLCDRFAAAVNPRAAKRLRYTGQPPPLGFAQGVGSRLPALMLLWIRSALPAAGYLVPIVVCHNAAAYQANANTSAHTQMGELKDLHIAQLFNNAASEPPTARSGYLNVREAGGAERAVAVQELCILGDFNLDFLNNNAGGSVLQRANHRAFEALTPTPQGGGSAGPPAGLPAAAGAPSLPVPAPPFPGAVEPSVDNIEAQQLRAAITTQATIQRPWPLPVPPPAAPPPAPYGSAALDNILYGGTRLGTAPVPPPGPDAGVVVNVAENIVQGAPGAPPQIELAATAAHYVLRGTKNANNAMALQFPGGGLGLTRNERLIGARLLSDHIPAVLQFECP